MHENRSPTLCLDGSAVRRIREEKKLTQLYIAKVVGVTTDTISRWENNRYPTVKRENVLKLAEALEVPLDEILRQAEPGPDESLQSQPPGPKPTRRLVVGSVLLALLILFLIGGYWLSFDHAEPDVRIGAERVLPRYAAPGSLVPVRVRLDVAGETGGLILRENIPPGWMVIEAYPPASSLDNVEGTIRWILKTGNARQTVSYLVRVSPEAQMGELGSFRGEVVAHLNGRGGSVSVAGAQQVRTAPYIWADLDGDGVIDDGEMLQASDAFDEMEGVRLDWSELETIWDAGRYRWDPETGEFHPVLRE